MKKLEDLMKIKPEEAQFIDMLINQLCSLFIEGLEKATASLPHDHRDIVMHSLLVRLNSAFIPVLAEKEKAEIEPFADYFMQTVKETIEWTKNKKSQRLEKAQS